MTTEVQAYSYNELLAKVAREINELFPWDIEELFENSKDIKSEILLIDVREPYEYKKMRIENSINVPRGVLETACEWAYDETVPALVTAKNLKVILICRSGNRSLLAAKTLKMMGYKDVVSLKTGLRGWNEYDMPLINDFGPVDVDEADLYHQPIITEEQMGPKIHSF